MERRARVAAATLAAAAAAAPAGAAAAFSNMNVGQPYLINNPSTAPGAGVFNTSYAARPGVEFFEVYAGPITTRYGEVFWEGLPDVPLPDDIVRRFAGKTLAVVGYEQDQVIRSNDSETADQPVPIYWAYNHHYVAWIQGQHSTMVDLDATAQARAARHMGHPLLMQAYAIDDPNPSSVIPTSQFFSEGNGGESRKSYHGYPKGMAQLIDSPTKFTMTPMQIDTWNRNTTLEDPYIPGPEPATSAAPVTGPDAVYSGHLECPCTDRVTKTYDHTHGTQTTGSCPLPVQTSTECFAAAGALQLASAAPGTAVAGRRPPHEARPVRAPAAPAANDGAKDSDSCLSLSISLNGTQCAGMTPAPAAKTDTACRQACCVAGAACNTWLFSPKTGCFLDAAACTPMPRPTDYYVGATAIALPTPGAAPTQLNATADSATLPPGCSLSVDAATNIALVTFNTRNTSTVPCGTASSVADGGGGSGSGSGSGGGNSSAGSASSLIQFAVVLDGAAPGGNATLTLSGPADVWFAVGLGARAMGDTPNAIVVAGNGSVSERKLADQAAGAPIATSVIVLENSVRDGERTVVLSRPFAGLTADHYSFDMQATSIDFIDAIGSTAAFSYHKVHAAGTLNLQRSGVHTCICQTGTTGYISTDMNPTPAAFSKTCLDEPFGDLVRLHNPSCTLEQYQGGLHCCRSRNILLDKDQNPWEDNFLTYYMKWRFYFENYTEPVNATPTARAKPASHQNLVRMFRETEAQSGEYDVVQAPPGTAPEDRVYQITSHFQLKDSLQECNPRTSPHCTGEHTSGISLVYASGHCHAPSCIKMELWNADTGALICRQVPHYGSSPTPTPEDPYDERGYVAIPPCLYGAAEDGLEPEHYLSYDQNLTSIKWNNNTYSHYGEMAMWQMRGYQAYQPEEV